MRLPTTSEEAKRIWPGGVRQASLEPLENMASNECFGPAGLATARFQAIWIEILRLREENARLSTMMGSMSVTAAIARLRKSGITVEPADGVPALWNVSGYPELTTMQLLQVAAMVGDGQ